MSLFDSHPDVSRLDTRALERREVVRTLVYRAEVLDVGDAFVELRTMARVSRTGTKGVATDGVPAEGDAIEGRYRVDLVGAGGVRLRYTEGEHVPDGDTPMVVAVPPAPAGASAEVGDAAVTLRAAEIEVRVERDPLRVLVVDRGGRTVAEIGGRERNAWSIWDAYNTGVQRTAEGGRPVATETVRLRPGECIYGFGEQFIGLDKVGQTIDVNMEEAIGTTTPRSYKNVPFYVSTHGYGLFANHSCRMTAWVGSRGATDVQLALEDDCSDLFVFVGDIATVLDRYTEVTGRPGLPPRWSFGFWQSKISYLAADETLALTRRLRAARLPFDVVHLDTFWFDRDWYCDLEFSPDRFPDPAAYLREMRELGAHVSLWQLPYIPEPSALFDELAAVGGFVRDADGEIYDVGICYTPGREPGTVGCIDFTNPAAVQVYQRHLARLFELGAAAIKADFGEQAPLDGVYHDGTPGHRMHNLYPLLYNRAVWEATERATAEPVIWARSAWAGSQRYPLHWGGDSSANWANLVPELCGGMSLGLSGFPFWSQDIGGFLGRPDPDLLIRWLQIGLFGSHARIHGFGDRELDTWGDDVTAVARRYLELRYALLPYIWAQARSAAERSLPMLRPLVVDFQDDPNTWHIADQWMFGDALLVAPITDPTNRRRAYLPAGDWADWWTGELVSGGAGGRWIDVEAPIDVLPMWQRAGTAVALGPAMQYVDEVPIDGLELRVVAGSGVQPVAPTSFVVGDDPTQDVHLEPEPTVGTMRRIRIDTAGSPVRGVSVLTAAAGGWRETPVDGGFVSL